MMNSEVQNTVATLSTWKERRDSFEELPCNLLRAVMLGVRKRPDIFNLARRTLELATSTCLHNRRSNIDLQPILQGIDRRTRDQFEIAITATRRGLDAASH